MYILVYVLGTFWVYTGPFLVWIDSFGVDVMTTQFTPQRTFASQRMAVWSLWIVFRRTRFFTWWTLLSVHCALSNRAPLSEIVLFWEYMGLFYCWDGVCSSAHDAFWVQRGAFGALFVRSDSFECIQWFVSVDRCFWVISWGVLLSDRPLVSHVYM